MGWVSKWCWRKILTMYQEKTRSKIRRRKQRKMSRQNWMKSKLNEADEHRQITISIIFAHKICCKLISTIVDMYRWHWPCLRRQMMLPDLWCNKFHTTITTQQKRASNKTMVCDKHVTFSFINVNNHLTTVFRLPTHCVEKERQKDNCVHKI